MARALDYTRRDFLGCSARNAAGVAAGVMGLGMAAGEWPPLRIGLIGLGQQGQELAQLFAARSDIRITALCDVDVRHAAAAQHSLNEQTGRRPIIVPSHVALLAREDVDAVVIATPGHWQAPLAIAACEAGKDIYLEQPVGLTIAEGLAVEQTAMQTRRIVQTGLPQRSGSHFRSAVQTVQSGAIGQVHLARAWSVHKRRSIGSCAQSAVPAGVDYAHWLGSATPRPFQANRFHQHWPWFWDYGAGELGLWGVQLLDVCRWGLNLELPTRVVASGGLQHFRDDRETPDTLNVQFEFENLNVIWEHRQWSTRGIEGRSTGVAFYGSEGTLVVDRSGWKVYDGRESLHADASDIRSAHVADFIAAVHERRAPSADISIGQRSMAMCHLGNLAWRSGSEIHFDPQTGTRLMTDSMTASRDSAAQFTEG